MITVERLHRADRQADAVERQGIALAQRGKLRMRRPAGAHVILRVHLEEPDWLRPHPNGATIDGLEADASTRGKFQGIGHVQHLSSWERPMRGAQGRCPLTKIKT